MTICGVTAIHLSAVRVCFYGYLHGFQETKSDKATCDLLAADLFARLRLDSAVSGQEQLGQTPSRLAAKCYWWLEMRLLNLDVREYSEYGWMPPA